MQQSKPTQSALYSNSAAQQIAALEQSYRLSVESQIAAFSRLSPGSIHKLRAILTFHLANLVNMRCSGKLLGLKIVLAGRPINAIQLESMGRKIGKTTVAIASTVEVNRHLLVVRAIVFSSLLIGGIDLPSFEGWGGVTVSGDQI